MPADTGDSAVHTADSTFTLASGADYDPAKDLAIPVQVQVENSTPRFDLDVLVGVNLNNPLGLMDNPTGHIYLVDFVDSSRTTTWSVILGNGTVSTSMAGDIANGDYWRSWSQIPPGGTGIDNGFYVIRDYFTPAHPDGPKGPLAKLGVAPTFGSGFVSSKADAQALSFSGKVIASGR